MSDEFKPQSNNRQSSPRRSSQSGSSHGGAKGGSTKGARISAAQALVAIFENKTALEVALSNIPIYKDLSARDRAFSRNIVATTIRHLGQIDAALKPFLSRPPSPYVTAILRAGTAQLLFLGTPVHAAVGESVAVLKRARNRGDANAAGMVNAVLRKVSEQGPELIADIAPEANLPDWLQQSWRKTYGQDNLRAMAKACLTQPPLDITVKADPEKWAGPLEAQILPTGTLRKKGVGNIKEMAGFEEGAWWIQDIAAALPVRILGDLSGKTALDMCAAPGGKTLQLAAAGAKVTALDRSADRLRRVTQNLQRTGLSAKTIAVDAVKWRGIKDHSFDVVLLDAPCSATGTLRRRPDVAWNKSPVDVSSLVQLQKRLLEAAARNVAPGGTLLYCTCSLEPAEGEAQIAAFLQSRTDFSLNSILRDSLLDMPEAILTNGYVRSLPHYLGEKGGMDGFFVAQLTYEQ